ncbi:hypothetical protein EON64_08025 [archaeon]|nr:MAG: hypothetical protein EON64_08025 [archaeon]
MESNDSCLCGHNFYCDMYLTSRQISRFWLLKRVGRDHMEAAPCFVCLNMVKLLFCLLLFCGSFITTPSDAFISPSSMHRRLSSLQRSTPPPATRLYGIPKLFRWLTDLYPLIVDSVGEMLLKRGTDYFYLDMNGIIHSCTHANHDSLITTSEQAMFDRIFAYTDRLYKLVRPRKQMFLAVDGVAPRAKMNQQREYGSMHHHYTTMHHAPCNVHNTSYTSVLTP